MAVGVVPLAGAWLWFEVTNLVGTALESEAIVVCVVDRVSVVDAALISGDSYSVVEEAIFVVKDAVWSVELVLSEPMEEASPAVEG